MIDPSSPLVYDLKDEIQSNDQQSSKKAILQKIIKIDEMSDPVAFYGTDTESEDPKPKYSQKKPKDYEKR
jgi:hypothetical protein